jgi:hypothetical protein
MAVNRKVEYLIEVKKVGDGGALAAQDFQNVEKASNQAKAAVGSFASMSTSQLRAAGKAGREALMLIGYTAFPQATMAAHGLSAGIKGLTGAAKALQLPLGAAAAAVLGIAAAAKTAYEGMRMLKAQMQEMESGVGVGYVEGNLKAAMLSRIKGLEPFMFADEAENMRAGINRPGADLAKYRQRITDLERYKDAKAAIRKIEVEAGLSTTDEITRKRFGSVAELNEGLAGVDKAVSGGLPEFFATAARNALLYAEDVREAKITQDAYNTSADITIKQLAAEKKERQEIANFGIDLQAGAMDDYHRSLFDANVVLQAQILKINELGNASIITNEQQETMTSNAVVGFQRMTKEIENARWGLQTMDKMVIGLSQSFSDGLAGAIVDAASGAQKADDAFRQFASNFTRQIAQMILQQIILNALQGIFGGGSGGGGSSNVTMAAGGMAFRKMAAGGMASVSSATYFPRFNVVAGEAGQELLAVLSRPRLMQMGGFEAAVGNMGPQRIAVTPAENLGRLGGIGGTMTINVQPSAGSEARITENSIRGARARVARDLTQDSEISRNVRGLL